MLGIHNYVTRFGFGTAICLSTEGQLQGPLKTWDREAISVPEERIVVFQGSEVADRKAFGPAVL